MYESIKTLKLLTYLDALALQEQLTVEGKKSWLLFSCPPTITLGKRGSWNDILISKEELQARGIRILVLDRGGQVTYHGPEQILGFPVGDLSKHVGDSRGVRKFMARLIRTLQDFLKNEFRDHPMRLVEEQNPEQCTGIWIHEAGIRKKIVSLGMSFSRTGISHGFALNVQPIIKGFELIHPCGEPDGKMTSVFSTVCSPAEFSALKLRLFDWLHCNPNSG